MLRTYSRKRREANKIIENVHDLCRLCLARADEPVPIFGEASSACAALPMRIMICLGHEVTQDDSLPDSICTNCHQKLERYYRFRIKCENSYLRLKDHYNATKDRDRISELQAENSVYSEESKANAEHLELEIEEDIEQQPDEMERLVIVDVYNIEENVEYDKPLLTIDLEMESDIKIEEKIEETTEIQVIQQSEDISPNISTFLNAILVELGVLVKNDQGLVVQDQGVSSFELETGDDQHVEFELVEEDDEIGEPVQPPEEFLTAEIPNKPVYMAVSEAEGKNVPVQKDVTDNKKKRGGGAQTGAWCAQCGRTFTSRGAARRHSAVHSGARAHACRDCGRRFAQKVVMERHRLVHQALRPHVCVVCGASFTQRGALAGHARAHAAPPPARPLALHACTLCDRLFLYTSGLSRHMLTHTGMGFKCATCERRFNDKSSLLRHTRSAHPQKARPP